MQSVDEGHIELVIGPMFGGKTEELISRIRCAKYAEHYSIIVKHISDMRYTHDNSIVSHGGIILDSEEFIKIIYVNSLAEVKLTNESVIAVDEGQFYPDLVEYCSIWADSGYRVIVAALDGDYKRDTFGQVCDLIPKCETVKKLNGICMHCRKRASSFSKKISSDMQQIDIGSSDKYQAVCRKCYNIAR